MNQYSILVVDDEPDNFDVIDSLLSEQNYVLHYAISGQEAIASLDLFQPDLILLDVMMPNMNGMEVCQRIKAMPQWQDVPIIMVTALTDKQDLAKCFTAGADDFISKPLNYLELISRVRSMLRIRQQYQQLADLNSHLEAKVQQRTAQLEAMITRDALTHLPSRNFLLQQLARVLQTENLSFAIIYLDCDQFKLVNGAFGHGVGDQLLIAIAERLQQLLRPEDLLARMGEDEFCFLLHQIDDAPTLQPLLEAILRSFDAAFMVANCKIFITACMGVVLGSRTYQRPEELLQDADTAMYKAKLHGKGCSQIFDPQMNVAMLNRLTLENDLETALQNQEFVLHYQPIIHLKTKTLSGLEALVRWQHPVRGMVSPAEFIPCMENTGIIVPLGLTVLKQACRQLLTWQQRGWTDLTMSVNLSVRQFSSPTLLKDIDQVLAEIPINPSHLKLEITESAIMENIETAIALTEQLRSRQIQISIDDFGTGYSSLSYLQQFPVNNLKIDRSFVSKIQSDNSNYQIVDMIITLSNKLKFSVIAEGIETTEQLQFLQQLACEFGQGYLFSKPLTATEIEKIYLT